jgi:hypothetical protein
MTEPTQPGSTTGETCGPCRRVGRSVPAYAKVEEFVPNMPVHGLSEYLCRHCFRHVMGPMVDLRSDPVPLGGGR